MRGRIATWSLGGICCFSACSPTAPPVPQLHYASSAPEAIRRPTPLPSSAAQGRPPEPPPPENPVPSAQPNVEPAPTPEAPRHGFHEPTPRNVLSARSPAMKAAALQPWQCRKELARRKLPFKRDRTPAKGIGTSVRFSGPLNGVNFVAPGRKSPFGKLDCRLALILDDFSKILAARQIIEVRVDNMYRPGAHLPGTRRKSQHNYGLAADITQFKTASGLVLDVEDDWAGVPGEPPCGPASTIAAERERSIVLRDVVCEVARAGLFHHMLTPNYNAAHRDHLHLDIKRGAKSGSIQ